MTGCAGGCRQKTLASPYGELGVQTPLDTLGLQPSAALTDLLGEIQMPAWMP